MLFKLAVIVYAISRTQSRSDRSRNLQYRYSSLNFPRRENDPHLHLLLLRLKKRAP